MANVPRAGIGASSELGGRSAAAPAGAGTGIGGSASAVVGAAGEFAPNVLTGWNKLSRVLSRDVPADLYHSANLVAAARRHLARIR